MSKGKNAAPPSETAARPVAENGVALYGRWVPVKVEGLAGVKTTLDLSTEEGKAALVAAGSPGDLEISEEGRVRFVCKDVAVFWDSEIDEETGEVSEFIRTCFYTADGRTFRTSSPHAPHFVARLVDVYGMERLKAGIAVNVRERVSKREKRRYHDFRVELPSRTAVKVESDDQDESIF